MANDALAAVRKGRIGVREAGNVSNSTSTACIMKKRRVAHYIAVAQKSESPPQKAKGRKYEARGPQRMFSSRTRIILLSFHGCCPSIVHRGRRCPAVALFKSSDDARGAAARAYSAVTSSGQDVMAAAVVPAHRIGLDGSLTEYSGDRILSVSSRDVAMDINLR